MAAEIKLDIRGSNIAKKLNGLRGSALYIASRSINDTAFGLKRAMEKHSERRLNIKNRAFNRFLVQKSSKTNLKAIVYHRFGKYGLLQKGGTRTPDKKYIAVPSDKIKHKRGRALQKILAQSYQRSGGGVPAYFIQTSRKGTLQIYKRTTKRQYPIEAQFILTRQAIYKKRLNAYQIAAKYTRVNMPRFFRKYIKKVLSEGR